jgi:hypothetical protein
MTDAVTFMGNPCFQRWIADSQARINIGLASKESLTYGATRIECLSSPCCDFAQQEPTPEIALVVTHLLGVFQNARP